MFESKGKIMRRLKIAKGHMQGIIFMIERSEYCISISQQLHAVKAALKKIDCMFLEGYLKNGGSLLNALKVIKIKN